MSTFIDTRHPQGFMIYVPGRGMLVNGQLDADAAQRLRDLGGPVIEYTWVEPISDATWFERASDQEKRERLAADLMLGRMPNADGVTRTERDIEAAMAKFTQDTRKATHVAKMQKRTPWRNW